MIENFWFRFYAVLCILLVTASIAAILGFLARQLVEFLHANSLRPRIKHCRHPVYGAGCAKLGRCKNFGTPNECK